MYQQKSELIQKIFITNTSNSNLIASRESSFLDFKANFNLASMMDYGKTMASFANKDGGCIVFGVKDKPREISGIDKARFDGIDPAKITESLNSYFQPEIEYEIEIKEWQDKCFGVIYTFPSQQKPIIAIKNSGDLIKDGEIYYRYGGKTEKIKYPELKKLLEEKLEKQTDAWMRIFTQASKNNPINTAVMNTISGEITGKGGTVIIDEALIPKLKFIREGQFSEKDGAPTLKLIGDVQPIPMAVVRRERVVIGEDIYKFRATAVADAVEKSINKKFSVQLHVKAWKKYEIRPSEKILGHKNEFCEFKIAENDYRYSVAWISLLAQKLKDNHEYDALIAFRI